MTSEVGTTGLGLVEQTIPQQVANTLKGSVLRIQNIVPGSRILVSWGQDHYFNEVINTDKVNIPLPIKNKDVNVRIRFVEEGSVYYKSIDFITKSNSTLKVHQIEDF